MRRWALFCALIACGACTRKLDVTVELHGAQKPDAFAGVSRVRMRALVAGRVELVGEGRWDIGPLDLPSAIDPDVERLVVEGLDADGRVISSGSSAPLDLLRAPPSGAIRIWFSRAGVLSELEARATPRIGGRALQLDDARVLIAGGTDETGCALETTEVLTGVEDGPRLGPPIAGGRVGDFHALAIGGGRALILGGELAQACGVREPACKIVTLDADASSGLPRDAPCDFARRGASSVVVSDTLMIFGGGEDASGVHDDVVRMNPSTLERQAPGKLPEPRTEAAAVLVSEDRVTFVGGRSSTVAYADAVTFDPVRGAVSPRRVQLGGALAGASAIVTGAGSAILAGGRDELDEALDRVRAMVIPPSGAQAFGDTSTVTAMPFASAHGSLIDLLDGSLLYLPAEGGPIARISLLPRAAKMIELPEGVAGPLRGGRTIDGTVLLVAESGAMAAFNPGPQAVLGAFEIGASIADSRRDPVGVVPLRPASWTIAGGRLSGTLPNELPAGGVNPGELAVLGSSKLGDFDARFELELGPLAQASFIFALDRGELDEVVFLGGLTLVHRIRRDESALSCSSKQTAILADPGAHAIRVRRFGGEVRVDVGADGTDDLVCATPSPREGLLAFGVIAGQASLGRLEITR